ncbi:deoxycytidylate deaminase-like [Trematomus bernacchii]|uniref:deoxycytidylate deaminase-like n=1 Tax=Trematomus bernacchii TaxID=40690 RepID=UPI00146E93BB|nr:deoxycytidylate deaminase-like [Trematomus bernacchii]
MAGKPANDNGARKGFMEPEDYFMAAAVLSARQSRDPNTQVGACIVNQDKKVVGVGYNKMPNGCEDHMPWSRSKAREAADAAKADGVDPTIARDAAAAETKLDTKYIYVCHAELNAIMNKNSADLNGCSIYVTLFPCNECAKLIIQAGMKEVVYLSDKYHDRVETQAAKRMFKQAKIPFRVFETKPDVVLKLRSFCGEGGEE